MAETNENGAGRPTVMTPEIIAKLREAFLMDLSDRAACHYANIGLSTLYDYQKAHPEFSEQKSLWKEDTGIEAVVNVTNSIKKEKNVQTSQWYLERTKKKKFGARTEITGANGKPLIPTKINETEKGEIESLINDQIDSINTNGNTKNDGSPIPSSPESVG